jgi:hypothetical protein
MDCFGSGQGQVAGCCESSNEPSGFNKMLGTFLTIQEPVAFVGRTLLHRVS